MASKTNHRRAFSTDPAFLERLARQGVQLDVESLPVPAALSKQLEGSSREDGNRSRGAKRLEKVVDTNKDGRRDRLEYCQQTGSLAAYFPGAALLSLNVMLRNHDAKLTALKRTWVKRIEALKLESIEAFRRWRADAIYPIIVEEIYITPEASLLDHEAVTAGCKPVLDAFVKSGFLPDDSGRFIAHPIGFTERGKDSGLLICFRPTTKPWGLIDDLTIHSARTQMVVE
ncbi:hypothetical protein [Pseudomonas guariconensis]|uniref:hypothetical protein n=1 Tax=Pseudomonas guariconensis TaxID=1288410 RepID=UPI003906744B